MHSVFSIETPHNNFILFTQPTHFFIQTFHVLLHSYGQNFYLFYVFDIQRTVHLDIFL